MFLRNISISFFIIIFVFLLFFCKTTIAQESNELIKKKLSIYLSNASEISSNFIQINDNLLQEGKFYLKNNRLRIEYNNPSKIIIVVKKNNAMYFNVDLQEVQYFNPNNTVAKFFFNLFNNSDFLEKNKIFYESNSIILTTNFSIDNENNLIRTTFEKSPLQIRKVEIINQNGKFSFGITNINYNPNLDDSLFSLANPLLS